MTFSQAGVLAWLLAACLLLLAQCGLVRAETGIASWYGAESGSIRADGKRFRPHEVTCAHKTLRLGTVVRVTDLATRRSILCPIRDRGPYIRGRIIDLSEGAASRLGIKGRGVARVTVERVK